MDLTDNQFKQFRNLIYNNYGIYLAPQKKQMLQGRLRKVMRIVGINNFHDLYQALIDNDINYWRYFDHEITTHKTDFFRENAHFQFIAEKIKMILSDNGRIIKNKEI
ncbi:MAG: hypothetical protein ACLFUI_04465, partial [Halanaerobiales bacterium]